MTTLAPPPPSAPQNRPAPEPEAAFLEALRAAVRGEVHADAVTRGVYSTDASLYQQRPQVVVVPLDADDVVAALKVAHRFGVPTTPRGGATSLSGQTFGFGMVLDLSKHMNRVLEINPGKKWARVQPGVVRDQLNAAGRPHGLHFAPDPATGSRATVGGMVGNNTCGTRSVVYGKCIDHTLEATVALADGTVIHTAPMSDEQWQARAAGTGVEAEIYRGVKNLINANQDAIRDTYPKVLRRVSGYNLDEFVDGAGYTGDIGPRGGGPDSHNAGRRTWNLTNLITGSEGTLGVLLEIKVRMTPNPAHTALCVVHFGDLIDSLAAVDPMLEHRPSTVELLDNVVIREAKVNPSTSHMAYFVDGDPAAVQIVEFFGETADEAQRRARDFAADMARRGIGYAHPVHTSAQEQADVWNTRKLGLGLISNVRGSNKGRDFIEDACVPTEHLAEYIRRIRDLCTSHGIDRLALYAHASVGVVHVVPALDLHHEEDVETMEAIATEVFGWCMDYGGSWSGEHGDGQLRGQFLPQMYGEQIYQAFREVKGLFDPQNLMNPGKVIDSPAMTEHLRYQQPGYTQALQQLSPHYHYRDQGGFALAVEQCNGVGACRKLGSGTMCPSYMATRDEPHSTRGRANTLRLAMSGQLGDDPVAALASDGVNDVLDLCLACKACKSECPNAVDMAKLKSDVLQTRHDRHGTPLGHKLMGRMPDAARRFSGALALIPNTLAKLPGYGWLLEKVAHIDRRRPLPGFATTTLRQRLRGRATPPAPTRRKVILFDDTYANYMEPENGVAALDLLEGLGYDVTVANAGCCQRTRLSKGLVKEARPRGHRTLQNLDALGDADTPILCIEPSCASALADDLPDLIDDAELGRRVARRVRMIDQFLAEEDGIELTADADHFLLHGHCHQKAAFGTAGIHRLFAKMDGVTCDEVDSGCCGMAGSFGYEHFDLSMQVGEDRLSPAVREAQAADTPVIACGISCRHQLHDALGAEAKHWVRVVRPKASGDNG